ncbi:major facilitator superfamily domain-containing protein [Penicillium angulare]|uniref:Major facilitator superfamily domain-containing protein n=1 Tax=Penicillium angulare TaxID=116970 RepID=A0A9W9FYU6_9EURO|nr:major facilitator superfamily domain-containing protein [Penicillium angulare]
MQSFRQYRRLRRDLQNILESHGQPEGFDSPNIQPDDDLLEDPNDVRTDRRISSMVDQSCPQQTSWLLLQDGRNVLIPGVRSQDISEVSNICDGKPLFLVGYSGSDDRLNPKNWSTGRKWATLGIVGTTGMLVGWASSIDSTVIKQGMAAFGVSEVAESLATALFLVAFAIGSLVAAPFSETVGRNPVYISTLSVLMIFTMASGLAPNFGAQLAFRFLAGLFGCTPMTTFGGSMSDIFDLMDRTYAFPVCCTLSFLGPFLAPMVGAFIGQSTHVSWRWTEWATLLMAAVVTGSIFLFVPETYGPVLLQWKAKLLRELTGDQRFVAEFELRQTSLYTRLLHSCSRPFALFFGEIMVALFTLYLVVVYIVLFGFLTGYEFIFGDTYGFDQGSVGLTFIGMNVGFLIAFALVPHVYFEYKRRLTASIADGEPSLPPEQRLWFAMYGAPWLPISLFWMGWTSYPSISYWSPLVASVAFGFSVQGIFISTYQYLIDTYEIYAASALVSATFFRYIAAGAMVVVSIPMYSNLGVHWSLTLLGCISLLMTPVPFIFYKYGHAIRNWKTKK